MFAISNHCRGFETELIINDKMAFKQTVTRHRHPVDQCKNWLAKLSNFDRRLVAIWLSNFKRCRYALRANMHHRINTSDTRLLTRDDCANCGNRQIDQQRVIGNIFDPRLTDYPPVST